MGTWRRIICQRDCPDACGLLIRVEGGSVVEVKGNPEHPVMRGYACPKAKSFPDLYFGGLQRRVLYPHIKDGGEFRRVSWEEAVSIVAERLGYPPKRTGTRPPRGGWSSGVPSRKGGACRPCRSTPGRRRQRDSRLGSSRAPSPLVTSTQDEFDSADEVHVSPEDAEEFGLTDGALAVLESSAGGRAVAKVSVDESLPAAVAWVRRSGRLAEEFVNDLVSPEKQAIGGGNTFNSTYVRLRPLPAR